MSAMITVWYNLQLSASGDTGIPEVVADPQGDVAKTFQNLGVCVVQQCAKIRQQGKLAVHKLQPRICKSSSYNLFSW